MLGALAKVTDLFTLDEIKQQFAEEFSSKLDNDVLSKNSQAMQQAYNEVN